MIGPSRQNRHGPVNLLREHDPCQGMGPGLWPEGQPPVGAGEQVGVQAICATYDQDQSADTLIPKPTQFSGKGPGGICGSPLIADDDMAPRKVGTQDVCFRGLAGFAGLNLDHVHRAKTKRTASCCGALDIGLDQVDLGRPGQPTHREDGQFQLKAICAEASTDQIFSIL